MCPELTLSLVCLANQVDELSRGIKEMDTPSSAEKRERGEQRKQQQEQQVVPRSTPWELVTLSTVP
jgi:hypothetical protein